MEDTKRLYVVYGENECVYIAKAQNKREAIDLAYKEFGYGELKKNYVAKDLNRELFNEDGISRQVTILI